MEQINEAAASYLELESSMQHYHPALIIEIDETLAPYCPLDGYTYAPVGDHRVQIIGQNNKRGETVTLAITRNNEILPFPYLGWSY